MWVLYQWSSPVVRVRVRVDCVFTLLWHGVNDTFVDTLICVNHDRPSSLDVVPELPSPKRWPEVGVSSTFGLGAPVKGVFETGPRVDPVTPAFSTPVPERSRVPVGAPRTTQGVSQTALG